jgi:hypothetical protein
VSKNEDAMRARMARQASRRRTPQPAAEDVEPDVAAEPAPVGKAGPAAAPKVRTKPYRITVDLVPLLYGKLQQWTVMASDELGERVASAQVIRALLRELDEDPALAGRIMDRLRQGDTQ